MKAGGCRLPTKAQSRELAVFDSRPASSQLSRYGGDYGLVGAPVSPARLAGMSASRIAGAAGEPPASALAPLIDAEANILTAALCVSTGGAPAAVCQSPGVRAAGAALPSPPAGETVPS